MQTLFPTRPDSPRTRLSYHLAFSQILRHLRICFPGPCVPSTRCEAGAETESPPLYIIHGLSREEHQSLFQCLRELNWAIYTLKKKKFWTTNSWYINIKLSYGVLKPRLEKLIQDSRKEVHAVPEQAWGELPQLKILKLKTEGCFII